MPFVNPYLMGAFVGDELRAESENTVLGQEITHGQYRALVLKRAIKLSRGNRPSTQHMYQAKLDIDRELGQSGRRIVIPGAAPGRRTI